MENIEAFEEEEEVNSFDDLCSNISTIYDEDYACRASASLNDDESDKVLTFVNQITFEKIKFRNKNFESNVDFRTWIANECLKDNYSEVFEKFQLSKPSLPVNTVNQLPPMKVSLNDNKLMQFINCTDKKTETESSQKDISPSPSGKSLSDTEDEDSESCRAGVLKTKLLCF